MVVYEKTIYKCTILVGENLWINIKIYFICINFFHKLKNKLNPNGANNVN
jgi:hypothetical protein